MKKDILLFFGQKYSKGLKRWLDIILASSMLLSLSPLLLTLILLIRLNSKGTGIFSQDRIGMYGNNFRLYKLRSMRVSGERDQQYWTEKEDPRITRIGQWLRKSSIDELPQLFNVILGSMSLVGPRPDVPVQQRLYTEAELIVRQSVRPGITGLAQVLLRNEGTLRQRTQYDNFYVRHMSLSLDMYILCATVKAVLKGSF